MVYNFGFIPNLSSQLLLHIISYLHLLLHHGLDGHLLAKQISLYCHRISQYCFTWLVSCTRSVNYSINKQIAQLSTMNTQLAKTVLSFSLQSYDLYGSSCCFCCARGYYCCMYIDTFGDIELNRSCECTIIFLLTSI